MVTIINDILRLPGESFEEYAIRLYKNKNIYNLTNIEIGDILNEQSGNDWDESTYRRRYNDRVKSYEEGYEKGYVDGAAMDENQKHIYIEDLRKEREKHYKSKRQLQDKLREYRRYLTIEARAENLKEVLLDRVEEMNENYPLIESSDIKISDSGRVGVLQISDWHYGEVIEDKLNEYNTEICKKRVEKLTSQTIEYINKLGLEKLIVLNLGDLVSGNIRVSARVMNETDIISQIIEVSEIIAQMLAEIQSKTCIKVEFYTVLDNHSRVSANYSQHIEAESFARITPWHLQARLKDHSHITILENKIEEIEEYDIGHFKIYDSDFLFVHGHNDRINSAISDISMLTKINPVSIFMGHLHSNIEKEEFEIDLIVNPSLIGLGAYSKSIRKSSQVRQKLNIYNRTSDNKAYRELMVFLNVKGEE